MSMKDRLWREVRHRDIDPEVLNSKADLPKGTVTKIFGGTPADDPQVVQLSVALDIPPSFLVYGVDDPANLWSDVDMRHGTGLNVLWRGAIDHRLTPREAHQLCDKVLVGDGRRRQNSVITQDTVERAYTELFGISISPLIGNDDPFDPRVED